MKRNYKYLWSLLPGLAVVAGNVIGGWWSSANLILSLGLIPMMEWFAPEDKSNESDSTAVLPDLIMVFHAIAQIGSLTALYFSVKAGRFEGIQYVLAAASTGIHTGSSSIVLAHEMIHRKSFFWQTLGKFLLFSAGNFYFFIEHLKVHHKWVGTGRDSATARRGESLYYFFVRSIAGQIGSAWQIECGRMRKQGRNIFHPSNYLVGSLLLIFLVLGGIGATVGITGVLVFLLQGLLANFLLEYTNYIEHYGLSRSEHERVTELHSWQTDKVTSRFILIDLCRHSDHHYYASKPYHTLKTYQASPVMPGGYASAIYLAMIPPLWFKVIHRKLDNFTRLSSTPL